MHYTTKEMRPNKSVQEDTRPIKIEVRSQSTGAAWSITARDQDQAQAIIDSLSYTDSPKVFAKPGQILIKVEVR